MGAAQGAAGGQEAGGGSVVASVDKAIQWSPQQVEAIARIDAWLADPNRKPTFYLAGFAGTGKSTILADLSKKVPMCVATFTGKAALVLRKKGLAGATTIHRMIYQPVELAKQELRDEIKKLREEIERDPECRGKLQVQINQLLDELDQPHFVINKNAFVNSRPTLIAIDECSMVGDDIGRDLLSFGIPILVIGDKAQLPPIEGTGFFTAGEPDYQLTEIHRQAADNPIIKMATTVRSGDVLKPGKYGESNVGSGHDEWWYAYDQILCGTHKMRQRIIRRMRAKLGYRSELPEVGEKIICTYNNHDMGLLNGSFWEVLTVAPETNLSYMEMTIRSLDDVDQPRELAVRAHKKLFYPNGRLDERDNPGMAQRFDFGYAITVHKSQGSQWNRVCLMDESHCWKRDGQNVNWLYTGITRAAISVDVVKGEL